MDPSMGRFASRIMLQAHRQEILLVHLTLRIQDRKSFMTLCKPCSSDWALLS